MAVSASDMNQIRVDVLGQSVDQATTWTTMPPGQANTLNTTARVINRAINALDVDVANALGGTNVFSGRFNGVIGDEDAADRDAFASIGSNLIQAVAALVAGGGVAPGGGRYVHEQTTADTEWSVEHEMGQRFVAVQLIDDAGTTMWADINFVDDDELTITFVVPKAGIAIVRR